MGWFVDRAQDRDTFEECYERMCAWLDYSHTADAFCKFLDAVGFLCNTYVLSPQKTETLPCIKACIRLIRFIFSSGAGHAEFQRQVVLPNIVKFSQALIENIGKYENEKLKVCMMSDFPSLPACLLTSISRPCVLSPSPSWSYSSPHRTNNSIRPFPRSLSSI